MYTYRLWDFERGENYSLGSGVGSAIITCFSYNPNTSQCTCGPLVSVPLYMKDMEHTVFAHLIHVPDVIQAPWQQAPVVEE